MANMPYCRFHNTLADLRDCRRALQEGNVASADERAKAIELIRLCGQIITDVASEIGEPEHEIIGGEHNDSIAEWLEAANLGDEGFTNAR